MPLTKDLLDTHRNLTSIVRSFPHGTELYFLRHGQTENNLRRVAQGLRMERAPLNLFGVDQAHEAGKKLEDTSFDLTFTSPAVRAKQTFEIARNYFISNDDLQFELKELHEIDWGEDIDCKPMSETQYEDLNRRLFEEGDYNATVADSETIASVLERGVQTLTIALKLLNENIDNHKIPVHENRPHKILFTGHGFFFGILLTAIIDSKIGLEQKPQNGGLKSLIINANGPHQLIEL